MDEKEKPSEKPEKRYTRKQIYDDPEVARDILRNRDDYDEDEIELARETNGHALHQLNAELGEVEPMPREDFTQQTVANLDAAIAAEVKRIKKRTK